MRPSPGTGSLKRRPWPRERLAASVTAVVAAGWLCAHLRVPVAWMVGPMLASAALNWAGRLYPVPQPVWRAAQALIGVSVASNLSREVLHQLSATWIPILGAVVATLLAGVAAGLALAAFSRMDRASSLLGFVPGAASSMVAASDDLGAEPALVALVQYLRLMLVLLSAPALVVAAEMLQPDAAADLTGLLSQGPGSGAPFTAAGSGTVAGGALALLLAGAGVFVASRVHLPAGALFVSMVMAALVASTTDLHPVVPGPVNVGALAVLGTTVGARFHREILARAGRVVLGAIGLSVGLIVVSGSIGWVLHAVTGLPVLTAFLATAPGAIETMTGMALATGSHPGLVLSVHVVRFILSMALGPALAGRLAGRPRRSG